MTIFENLCSASGRILLGLYFFLAGGVNKVFNYQATADYMADHAMIMIPFLLFLTTLIQLVAGAFLIVGFQTKISAFLLAGLTLVISLVLHDFWTLTPGELQTAHETQNFVKNMGILAGLLAIAGLGRGPWSLESRMRRASQANG